MKHIKLAGIQMQSLFGQIQKNLEHASALYAEYHPEIKIEIGV